MGFVDVDYFVCRARHDSALFNVAHKNIKQTSARHPSGSISLGLFTISRANCGVTTYEPTIQTSTWLDATATTYLSSSQSTGKRTPG